MVRSSGGKMIVNFGKWPCGVCGKGVQANSVQCTVCKKWIYKPCSSVRGDLSRVANGFRCRRCDGTIKEADLTEDLLVDGETYECVELLLCGGAVTANSSCCANCVEPFRSEQWAPDLPFLGHAGHVYPLDGWRCCSQKRVMSRPI